MDVWGDVLELLTTWSLDQLELICPCAVAALSFMFISFL